MIAPAALRIRPIAGAEKWPAGLISLQRRVFY
jgi:hypothetical protein